MHFFDLAVQGHPGLDASLSYRHIRKMTIETSTTPYILLGSQVAICGKNQSSNTITHISKKNGKVTFAI